jgi:DNA-binding LytR/AlgR family response regulator
MPVLVAEDRYLVANEITRMLRDLGCEPVGPAPDVRAAFRLLAHSPEHLGCAVLDVDLRGQSVFPLATELRQRGVPVLFATGYDQRIIPEAWRAYPRLQKPFGLAQLQAALQLALGTQPRPFDASAALSRPSVDSLAEVLKESRNIVMASRASFNHGPWIRPPRR